MPTIEAELKRRTAAGALVDWLLNDDGTERVRDPQLDITLSSLRDALLSALGSAVERRYEWQLVGTENKPLYIGQAPSGSLVSDEVWSIDKYTFAAGPAPGTTVITRTQRVIGSWDDRASLF